jgi:competence CoiA-like predicted nuclease
MTDRVDDIRALVDEGYPVFGIDVRWLLDEVDTLRERVAILRAEVADLEGRDA